MSVNPGIFARSIAGYLVILLLLGASNVYAILKLVQFSTANTDSQNIEFNLLETEQKLVDSFIAQQRYGQQYVLTRDASLYHEFQTANGVFKRHLASINTASLNPAQQQSLAKVKISYQQYESLTYAEFRYLQENQRYDSSRHRTEAEKTGDALLKELEKLEDYSHEQAVVKARMAREAGAAAQRVAVISFIVTLLLSLLLSFLITRSITAPLLKLVKKTREIPDSLFECELDVSSPPEITALTEAFSLMCLRLREVDKIKSDFFAMISHELRTPLTTVKEGTSLLLEGAGGQLTDQQERLLTIIGAECNRLTTMVNSILDLAKMEAGMMQYAFAKESISPLIEKAMTEISPYAESKNIRLEQLIDREICTCRMDAARILDVLRNLIGNAVKFTPSGGIITLAAYPAPGGIEVSVTDTGPGIPEQDLSVIFDKFTSSDKKRGTGLGLALVKNIIEAHGGTIRATSEPGKGSTFIFSLPD